MNDPAEGQRISTAQYRQQLASAIAQGIQSYNTAVNYRSENSTFAFVPSALPAHSRSIVEPLQPPEPATPPAAAPPTGPSISINGRQR
jgi:predicted aldo/keto reductase-like oxidoreductase